MRLGDFRVGSNYTAEFEQEEEDFEEEGRK